MSTPAQRIAVIAVHGVADQPPGDTARRCTELLMRDRDYQAAAETPLHLEVEPFLPREQAEPAPAPPKWFDLERLSLLSPAVRRAIERYYGVAEEETAGNGRLPLEHRDFRDKLRDLELPADQRVWDTVRFETRSPEGAAEPCEVHVHELYWADLSRLGGQLAGLLVSLYQFLFMLGTLGATNIGFARGELQGEPGHRDGLWRLYGGVYGPAVRLLTIVLPTFNLALVGLVTVLAVGWVGRETPQHLAWLLLALPLAGVVSLLYQLHLRAGARGSALALAGVLTAVAAYVVAGVRIAGAEAAAVGWLFPATASALWLVALAGTAFVLRALDRRIPGALLLGGTLLVFVPSPAYLSELWRRGVNDWEGLFEVAVATAGGVVGLTVASGGVIALLALVSTAAGQLAARRGTPEARRRDALRIVRTAGISLALPTVVMLILTLGLWGGGIQLARTWLGPEEGAAAGGSLLSAAQVGEIEELWRAAIPPGFIVPLAILGLALLVALWAITPSVLADVSPGSRRSAHWHGTNLTFGFRLLGVTAWLLQAVVAALAVVMALQLSGLGEPAEPWLQAVIIAVGAGLIAAIVGKGPASFLAFGFRASLDVALDVLNWLRHTPRGQAPGGLIASRYVSLLRYLCRWRSPVDGRPYDAVIVVAHSQGAVITADLLRFLDNEWAGEAPAGLERLFDEAHPAPLPLYLLTFGCPLHQLYGLMLPFRYGWTRDAAGKGWATGASLPAAPVQLWINAYRSADFVGRFLWHQDAAAAGAEPWQETPYSDPDDRRRELCIGPGGHNSYWGSRKDSEPLAAALDDLIESACGRRTSRLGHVDHAPRPRLATPGGGRGRGG